MKTINDYLKKITELISEAERGLDDAEMQMFLTQAASSLATASAFKLGLSYRKRQPKKNSEEMSDFEWASGEWNGNKWQCDCGHNHIVHNNEPNENFKCPNCERLVFRGIDASNFGEVTQ